MSDSHGLHVRSSAQPDAERHYKEELTSAEWDVGDGRPPRLKYAILSLPRTGSEYLCASLRRRGIGVPLEYLGLLSIAGRLGCIDQAGNTPLAPYFAQLHAKRTTLNGIFGIKVHPLHVSSFAHEDIAAAADFFAYFDRVFVLRRRDKLLQAISLARALLTDQFHVFAPEQVRPLDQPDRLIFEEIAAQLASILRDEDYVARVLSLVDRQKVTTLWYEDLSDPVIERIATGLAAAAGHVDSTKAPFPHHATPQRSNPQEALALKRRFLAFMSGQTV